MQKNLYITQSGKISRKDNTLFFENEKIKKVIPIEGIEAIFCYGETSINSKLLDFLSQNKITVHFFNYYGFYSGSYHPKESYVSGSLLVKQVEHYQNLDKRLFLAKKIVEGIADNLIFILIHYYKHNYDVSGVLERIKGLRREVLSQNTIFQILKVEGAIWDNFYRSFKKFLPEDFLFDKRVKRPPDNPLNAMISFGNSMLYTQTLSQIYQTQLNPTISYLHEPFERRFSLSLDVSEVFKPTFVFQTIFKLVNKKMIKIDDFDQKMNWCYLNAEGRKKFVMEFDKKLGETFSHEILKRKTSNLNLVKLECYKLIKHLLGEKEYKPFNAELSI